jgi:tRNA(adenine34) deaminase
MFGETDKKYMEIALKQARLAAAEGEIPVGAVMVVDNAIIALDHNRRERNKDATAHAEILVIQEACRRLQRWRLSDSVLYVTLEPCPMCAGAIYNARIKRVVYGAPDSKGGACGSLFNVVHNKYLNHQSEVTAGVLEQECAQVLKDFLNGKR